MSSFVDESQFHVKAGNGGAGCVSFRREAHVAKGGPDGGDGGKGGNVWLVADSNVSSLLGFKDHPHREAPSGKHGSGKNRHGANGGDIEVSVPEGTVVRDRSGAVIADLSGQGARWLAGRGGRGGHGNARFLSNARRAPAFAEQGEMGEETYYNLELKLMADVAIVGFPNAGKSTLISRISAAKPKIADYPFTTLVPNLGVVSFGGRGSSDRGTGGRGSSDRGTGGRGSSDWGTGGRGSSDRGTGGRGSSDRGTGGRGSSDRGTGEMDFTVADIPGLVEGASQGRGLGHRFLRHVERARALLVLIDLVEGERAPDDQLRILLRELGDYNADLLERPRLVIGSRSDSANPDATWNGTRLSAVTGENVAWLVGELARLVDNARRERPEAPAFVVHRPEPEGVRVSREAGDVLVVRGRDAERAVALNDLTDDEALAYVHKRLGALGVHRALARAGAREGDVVRIGALTFEYEPDF